MFTYKPTGKTNELVALGAALAFALYALTPEHEFASIQKLVGHIPGSSTVQKLKSKLCDHTVVRWIKRKLTAYDVYNSVEEKEKYWKSALFGQRVLNASDAKYVGRSSKDAYRPPLVMYYTPALPPIYRDRHREPIPKTREVHLQEIGKFQQMIYPESDHLRPSEALCIRRNITPRVAKGIRRITRKESSKRVFSKSNLHKRHQRSVKYRAMWKEWEAEPHDPELTIVFE